MPICERDPWRQQYFENVTCPDHVLIPTDDRDAWGWNPQHNWVYDRLRIAQSQGLQAAPHGVLPETYPVFSKPIINLGGMGVGSRSIASPEEMLRFETAGHFWSMQCTGPHLSSDCAIVNGEVRWLRHATGIPAANGMFAYWHIMANRVVEIEVLLTHWVAKHMRNYTGMMNFETIGTHIIEAHLRFADQWVDLNGKGWIDALVALYTDRNWICADDDRRDGYSIPLFASHGGQHQHPPEHLLQHILKLPEISSIQITFHNSQAQTRQPMPPGGFRLALVNCWSLAEGQKALKQLGKLFPQAQLFNLFATGAQSSSK